MPNPTRRVNKMSKFSEDALKSLVAGTIDKTVGANGFDSEVEYQIVADCDNFSECGNSFEFPVLIASGAGVIKTGAWVCSDCSGSIELDTED